jgi:uncharacterized protein YcnI
MWRILIIWSSCPGCQRCFAQLISLITQAIGTISFESMQAHSSVNQGSGTAEQLNVFFKHPHQVNKQSSAKHVTAAAKHFM